MGNSMRYLYATQGRGVTFVGFAHRCKQRSTDYYYYYCEQEVLTTTTNVLHVGLDVHAQSVTYVP